MFAGWGVDGSRNLRIFRGNHFGALFDVLPEQWIVLMYALLAPPFTATMSRK